MSDSKKHVLEALKQIHNINDEYFATIEAVYRRVYHNGHDLGRRTVERSLDECVGSGNAERIQIAQGIAAGSATTEDELGHRSTLAYRFKQQN